MSALRIGVDVGGTFTDLVSVDADGRVTTAKSPSTPEDQSLGVLEGLARLAGTRDLTLTELLASTERIVHGTTVATNALLERKGAQVGLLTTEGHRDVLEMREGLKDDRYALRQPAPEPLVPRALRLPVRERVRADGAIETPLGMRSLRAAIGALREAGVEAVAVCYLHAYRDPAHERATAEALARLLPDAYISLSSEVLPQIKEYERVCTTVVNAFVGPALDRYLGNLSTRLAEAGYGGPLLVVQSHGGLASVDDAVRLAAGAVLSGPAAGVAGARRAATVLDCPDLIAFDMGGTSTDVSLIVGGEASVATDRRLAGQRIGLRSLDIVSVGAGGGSIARVDEGGVLHVGPESAGASPGPACYGRGGSLATVTDANLVLGILDPEGFLGGRQRLDVEAATRAVDAVAARLGVERTVAAEGIQRVVNTRMAEGIRLISVRRGVDPRRFALLAFGGAAGCHVTDVARQLELDRVAVPRLAPVMSAWGMLASDLRYEIVRTHIGDASALDASSVDALYREMEAEGRGRLEAAAFAGAIRCRRFADIRYGEQIFEIEVALDEVDWAGPDPLAAIAEAFHRRHEALYTYALRDQEVVLVNARVAVTGALDAPPGEPRLPAGRAHAVPRRRRAYIGGWRDVPVFDVAALAPGQTIEGPALVDGAEMTVLLRERDRARTTPEGWLDVLVA